MTPGGSEVVERALRCLGRGFDVTCDFRPKHCRGKERLVMLNEEDTRELAVPGFGSVLGVSVDIKCDKGDRTGYQSGVLSFSEMSELFNRKSSLAGRIPLGFFNSMFQFSGSWARDAAQTRHLAFNGYFITLFNLCIDQTSVVLSNHITDTVPSSWQPAALARFIENYGTHIIVGLSVGGQDVVFLRQEQFSSLLPAKIKDYLDRLGNQLFTDTSTFTPLHLDTKNRLKVPEFASLLGQPDDGDFDQSMESLPSCSLSFASARDISFRSLPFSSTSVSEVAFDEGIDSRSCSDHIVINNELEEIASLEWLARCMAETNMSRSSCESAAGSPIQNKWHGALLPALSSKAGITVTFSKRGGDTSASSHCEWLPTVSTMPDVINFTFVPITSLLKGVPGIGFLSHAINLYTRYKPPIQDLEYFLDFQLPKAWAPIFNDLPLGRSSNRPLRNPALQFSLMGPKLYVNTTEVTVGRRPVTGMRLYLEGRKNDRLAVHLQHLHNVPAFFGDQMDTGRPLWRGSADVLDERYHEPVQWKVFSHVCTAAVKYDPEWAASSGGPSVFIVTGAQLQVKTSASRSVLHLRLLYSEVPGCVIGQSSWGQSTVCLSQGLGLLSTISEAFSGRVEKKKPEEVMLNSAKHADYPPIPVRSPRLLKFVDTTELCRGPQDGPGYWLVTGARLATQKGKIGLHVKFSLVNPLW